MYELDQRVKKIKIKIKIKNYFIDPSVPVSLMTEWCFKDLNEGC